MTGDKEKKIADYLGQYLPASEPRIPIPMNPSCEVCVVIPCYAEREYLLHPLQSLARQEAVTPDQYEVIVVVNNPGVTPPLPGNSPEHYRELLANNRETLKLLEIINGQGADICLTPKEEEIINDIRQRGLKVYSVDKSSAGKTLPQGEANVGGARNRGAAEAVERFLKYTGKNGIIAQTDADTHLDPGYIHGIIDTFKKHPQVVGLSGISEDIPGKPGDRELMIEFLKMSGVDLYHQLLHGWFLRENPVAFVPFSGSCMATRAIETVLAGGIPGIPGAEDLQLGYNLAKIGKTIKVEEVVAFPAIRISLRTATGRGRRMAKLLNSKNSEEIQVRSIDAAYHLIHLGRQLLEARQQQRTTPRDLQKILTLDGEPLLDDHDLERLSQHIHEFHTTWEDLLLPDLKELLRRICDGIDDKYKPVSILAAIPLLIDMYRFIEPVKNKFPAVRTGMVQERKQDIALLEFLLDEIFSGNQPPVHRDRENLFRHLTFLLDHGPIPCNSQLLRRRYRLKRIAEIISCCPGKEEALDLIGIEYMKYLFLPGQEPLPGVFFDLQVLVRVLEELK
jgi:GT2 family glycosyltransferase